MCNLVVEISETKSEWGSRGAKARCIQLHLLLWFYSLNASDSPFWNATNLEFSVYTGACFDWWKRTIGAMDDCLIRRNPMVHAKIASRSSLRWAYWDAMSFATVIPRLQTPQSATLGNWGVSNHAQGHRQIILLKQTFQEWSQDKRATNWASRFLITRFSTRAADLSPGREC